MSQYRTDGIPEQRPVRESLALYLMQFDCYKAAAAKIGTDTGTLRKWRRGAEPIPVWFCEYLGFRKVAKRQFQFVGQVRFIPTEKRA